MDETYKMAEIAWLQDEAKAHELVKLLKTNGVESFISNKKETEAGANCNISVKTSESNVDKALQIMDDNDFDFFPNLTELQKQSKIARKQIIIYAIVLLICIGFLFLRFYSFFK